MTSLQKQIIQLEPYLEQLLQANSASEKLRVLGEHPLVQDYLLHPRQSYPFLSRNTPEYDIAIRSIIAIGQGPVVFNVLGATVDYEKVQQLLHTLLEVEHFYAEIGGILGYHLSVLKLICENESDDDRQRSNERYLKPEGPDLSEDSPTVRRYIREGIEQLPEMAEIYPVGGAGDRLDLHDEATGEALPAARLPFGGRTLLEGLFRDLQAREYLYYKLYGKQLETPVAMMTSQEKNNHQHILGICQENDQFGRHPHSFHFFMQPLSPVITVEGNWSLSSYFNLTMKPGGHGVIWKLALEQGIFSSLEAQGRTGALVRQINNPMAGVDQTLLSFTGYGLAHQKVFGFASCPRLLNTAEGMNVLLERKNGEKNYSAGITNIEYTVFARHGLKDHPCSPGSPFSAFPANTNILFVLLSAVRAAVHRSPFPGKNINMKTKLPFLTPDGEVRSVESGRLETTMQNISDALLEPFDHPVEAEEHLHLKTYITYHDRLKTISVTKKSFSSGCSLLETPEGCFYDQLRNHRNLLVNSCQMELPELNSEEDFLAKGPAFIVQFHPALGPLYSIIKQKIRGGRLALGAELQLEIAEVELENLELEGSLRLVADSVAGQRGADGILHYGEGSGKCILRNVCVTNAGINREASNSYWKNWILHDEVFSIVLRGNGEFYAENVTFRGRQHIEVPEGIRLIAMQEGDSVRFIKEKISAPTWYWRYHWDQQDRIILKKEEAH